MNTIDHAKDSLLKNVGIDFRTASANAWLNEAMEYEQLSKASGPFDPAYERLIIMRNAAFDAALLREKYPLL